MPVKNILVVICTFNPHDRNYDNSFKDFTNPWFDVIRSWQMQRSSDLNVDIVIADDVSGPKTRAQLIEFQKKTKDFYIDFVNEWFTSQFIGFNHAVSLFNNKHYDYYAYCASDASFCNKGDLKALIEEMDENCVMISPQADRDMAQRFDFNKNKPPTRVSLGDAVCNHIGIWTHDFMKAYDYKYVDILGGPRNEGFYLYLAAAIKGYQLLSHKIRIHHVRSYDRGHDIQPPVVSSCYARDFYKMLDEGMKIGLGFEECLGSLSIYWNAVWNAPDFIRFATRFLRLISRAVILNPVSEKIFNSGIFETCIKNGIIPKRLADLVYAFQAKPYCHFHNSDCFDENGYAKTDELYRFLKKNIFLTKKELDYKKIPFQLKRPV